MQRDASNGLQSFFSLAYRGKPVWGQSLLPTDDSLVALQQWTDGLRLHGAQAPSVGLVVSFLVVVQYQLTGCYERPVTFNI